MRLALLGALALVCAAPSGANVMTFSGPELNAAPYVSPTYQEDGITATSPDGGFVGGQVLHIDSNSRYLNSTYDFTLDSGLFDLKSADILGVRLQADPDDPADALVTGYNQAGDTIYFTSIPTSPSPGTVSFNWTGLARVRFKTTFEHYNLDNVVMVAAAAVPEPETWAMLIVGFGFVGGAMRRSEKQRPSRQPHVASS